MKRKLTIQDYVAYMDDVATYRCTFVIKKYFNGNVDAFYNAPSKFKEWSSKKSPALYKSAWAGISHYNFAGIENKYIQNIFGKNYHDAEFMHRVREELKRRGYELKPKGTLPYKNKVHHYCAKYLPPKSRMEAIFANKDEVTCITSPSSYCNKVKKILDAMMDENSRKAGKDVSKWKKNGKKDKNFYFTSPCHLCGEIEKLLMTGKAGGPGQFWKILQLVFNDGDETYGELRREWFRKQPVNVTNMFVTGDWKEELANHNPRLLETVYRNKLAILKKIEKQLETQNASRMFKDEYNGKDENGVVLWKPASEKRIAELAAYVENEIRKLNDNLKELACTTTARKAG